jgi:hypothetical protein
MVQSQPRQIVWETLSQRKPTTHTKKCLWSDSRFGPELKHQYWKKKKIMFSSSIHLPANDKQVFKSSLLFD